MWDWKFYRFLSKQALNITKLATTKSPDKLIYDLANYKINNPNTKLKNSLLCVWWN